MSEVRVSRDASVEEQHPEPVEGQHPEPVEGQRSVPLGNPGQRGEFIVLVVLALILVVVPAAILGYQFVLRRALSDVRTIDIVAAAPEAGGFHPDAIRVPAGETVRLRFSVPDVTHGIAIGPGLGLDLGHIDPGQVKEVEMTFDRPGRYTWYCNSWCSPSHWRMRGTIEVYDPQNPDELQVNDVTDPVLESLAARNVDIDAPHAARVVPAGQPSPVRGAALVERLEDRLPVGLANPEWRRTHSPVEASESLVETGLSEDEAWDAVAYLWLLDMEPDRLQTASTLYAKNCAACHGESGGGQGPGADALVAQSGDHQGEMSMVSEPAAFADPEAMLGGSGDVYYAKLRRGGMGTGMPSFGPILTPEETWALVDYLWTFVFQPEGKQEASGSK
jgi:mono/diheme cytochrome c family protein/plastocyanin